MDLQLRKHRRNLKAIAALILIAVTLGTLYVTNHKATNGTPAPPPVPRPSGASGQGGPGTSPLPKPTEVYNVVNFGADRTGQRDSTNAIRAAITAAEAHSGSEVYFPPGKFILDQPSPKLFDFVINKPIQIIGAGISATTIINEVGQKTPGVTLSTDMFAIEVAPGTQTGGGSGTIISNMTLDSATYDAGTDIMDFANHTTLSNLKVLAASSTNTYNYNSFGIRVIAICNPNNISYKYRVGNVINNVTIIGKGQQGTTELDLSCQVGTSASNITIVGNGLDIFYCHNDTVSNANLTSGNYAPRLYTWVITGSTNISLSNIIANGMGGTIAPDVRLVSNNISIENESMTQKYSSLYIGDSRNVSILNSSLGGVIILPRAKVDGLKLDHTSVSLVICRPGASTSNLSGLACPPYSP